MTSNVKALETIEIHVKSNYGYIQGTEYKQSIKEAPKDAETKLKTPKRNEFEHKTLSSFTDVQTAFVSGGVEGVADRLQKLLENWKTVPVNIAVIGQSGSGKSSFINAVRGLDPEDNGAAKTGETEKTLEPQQFTHPDNESVVFWDLPGVGTTNCLREKYLQEKYFDRYDFFIIISCDRFKDDDLWLAKQVKTANKKFYFIRSKVDQDIRNAREDYPKRFNEELTLKKIKEDCVKKLAELHDPPIFIISNRNIFKWEFPKAIETLYLDIPELQREAFAFSLSNLAIHTHKIIETKKELLANRAHAVAMMAAIGSVFPLPEIGVNLDKKALEDEDKFYRQQFGINSKIMEEHGLTAELQIEEALAASYAASSTTECVADKLEEYADADSFISVILQMGKMATNACVSYKLALATLKGLVDMYAQIALQSTLKPIAFKALEL